MPNQTLGARIRARSRGKIANNPYMSAPDPGLRTGLSRGPRGYGGSNVLAIQAAHKGMPNALPSVYDENYLGYD